MNINSELNDLKIGVIILSYKNYIDTYECIKSIKNSKTNHSIEICLVENSPENEYYEKLKKRFNDINIIKSTLNLGYAHGNNIGLSYFINKGLRLFLIINNDTIVTDFFIDKLIESYLSSKGIISPLIFENDDKNKVWSAGGYFSKVLACHRMFYNSNHNNEIQFLSGCCIMFDLNIIHKIGFLSESYFMYGEDSDFSYNAYKNKIPLIVNSTSIIYHKVGRSSIPNSPFQLYYLFKSRFLFLIRNYKNPYLIYGIFINILQTLLYIFKYLLLNPSVSKSLIFSILDMNKKGRIRF